MHRTIYTFIIVVLALTVMSLCSLSCEKKAPVDPGIEDEEYRVMSAALKYFKYQRTYAPPDPSPIFTDSLGKTGPPPIRKRPERPREFRFALDTTKARAAHKLMLSIYGEVKYYLTVMSRTVDRDGMHLWWYGDESEVLQKMTPIMRDLYMRNQKEYQLDATRFRDSLIVRLVDLNEFHSPEEMYSLLPLTDGRIRLSRVGFSPDRQHAIMFHYRTVHPIGGSSLLVSLDKVGDRWVVVDAEQLRDVLGGY